MSTDYDDENGFSEFDEEDETNEKKINELLEGISTNRDKYKDMLVDMETMRGHIDKLLPSNMDYKKKFLFEERMKTITSILGTELDIRKSLENSYKLEIELRKKLYEGDDNTDKVDKVDMIAKALAKLENKKTKKI
jgi:hypothetical protein